MRLLAKRLTRFSQLSWTERLLLFRVAAIVASVRLSLLIIPLESARRVATVLSKATERRRPELLVWAVIAASRYVPGATCLAQALSLQALLAHSGRASRVAIGISKPESRRIEAHAWVVSGDQVLIGGPEVGHYEPLAVLEVQEQSYAK